MTTIAIGTVCTKIVEKLAVPFSKKDLVIKNITIISTAIKLTLCTRLRLYA
jgi:hypothetical protein